MMVVCPLLRARLPGNSKLAGSNRKTGSPRLDSAGYPYCPRQPSDQPRSMKTDRISGATPDEDYATMTAVTDPALRATARPAPPAPTGFSPESVLAAIGAGAIGCRWVW